MKGARKKVAVILFNLGGPDGPADVRPFLRNLFSDPAIIRLPGLVRLPLAALIAWLRAGSSRRNYALMEGGGSPLLANTRAQAEAVTHCLADDRSHDFRAFVAMRYWPPRALEAARAAVQWGAEELVLLPLYPHYSTTTTQSSFDDWRQAQKRAGAALRVHAVCCYPQAAGLVAAQARRLQEALTRARRKTAQLHVLFSAHGLPRRVVEDGDPYPEQIGQNAAALAQACGLARNAWTLCYQSRVGPVEWIGPATPDEIRRAGARKTGLVVCPISFVSEHIETLVELDIEYRALAEEAGVPVYERVPTPGCDPAFIGALAEQVRAACARDSLLCPEDAPGHLCLSGF